MPQRLTTRQRTVNFLGPATSESTPSELVRALAVLVKQANAALTTAGDALAAPTGHTSARWWVLAAVEERPATVSQIARILGVTRQSVQRIADDLTAAGSTRYLPNPQDRRARLLTLTADGQMELARIQAAQAVWARELGAAIGSATLESAVSAMEDVLGELARRDGDVGRWMVAWSHSSES